MLSFFALSKNAHHTTPEEIENRYENGAFRKRSSNRKNSYVETPVLRVSVDGKHFENEVFENGDVTIIVIFPSPSFTQTQIQNDR